VISFSEKTEKYIHMEEKMKRTLTILLVVLLTFALVGCENNTKNQAEPSAEASVAAESAEATAEESKEVAEAEEDITINFIFKHMAHIYWELAAQGAEAAAKDLGFKVNILAPITNGSNDEQIALIEQSLAQGVDAIVLAPNDSQAIIPACKQIMDSGVVLINMSTAIGDNTYDAYVGIENYKLGKAVAEKLCEMGNNAGKAVIIEGPLGQQNSVDRADGAAEAFEAAGIEVVSRQSANWARTEALALVQNLLQEYSDIKYIFACNDEMGLGAYEAAAQAGRDADIFISGIDATPEGVQSISEGKLDASCSQDSYGQAYECAVLAMAKIKGEDIEDVILDGDVVTIENAADFLTK